MAVSDGANTGLGKNNNIQQYDNYNQDPTTAMAAEGSRASVLQDGKGKHKLSKNQQQLLMSDKNNSSSGMDFIDVRREIS